jgi:hypothetical protein
MPQTNPYLTQTLSPLLVRFGTLVRHGPGPKPSQPKGPFGQAWLESGMARALSLANQRAPVGFWDLTQTYVPYLANRHGPASGTFGWARYLRYQGQELLPYQTILKNAGWGLVWVVRVRSGIPPYGTNQRVGLGLS